MLFGYNLPPLSHDNTIISKAFKMPEINTIQLKNINALKIIFVKYCIELIYNIDSYYIRIKVS